MCTNAENRADDLVFRRDRRSPAKGLDLSVIHVFVDSLHIAGNHKADIDGTWYSPAYGTFSILEYRPRRRAITGAGGLTPSRAGTSAGRSRRDHLRRMCELRRRYPGQRPGRTAHPANRHPTHDGRRHR